MGGRGEGCAAAASMGGESAPGESAPGESAPGLRTRAQVSVLRDGGRPAEPPGPRSDHMFLFEL